MAEIETDQATAMVEQTVPPAPHGIAHLATRVFGTPLLIAPEKFEVIMHVLGPSFGIVAQPVSTRTPAVRKWYEVTPDGIAIIPIEGTLVHKSYGMDALSGLQSYSSLQTQIEDAATDPGD